jgi:hypothetical protein
MPLVSIGSRTIAMKDTRYNAPDSRIGPDGFDWPICAAITGAVNPASLLSNDAIPEPVPRTGAGKTSGVYAYITPYITFCQC